MESRRTQSFLEGRDALPLDSSSLGFPPFFFLFQAQPIVRSKQQEFMVDARNLIGPKQRSENAEDRREASDQEVEVKGRWEGVVGNA